ncbi:MAG TPA: ABC transporter ATP-binding protein [Candidatus Eremiobacteraceae bacterium]|nr:ABC transporter ATP-binding protein [Candidatus Eremiobacteraceae bacterium]
MTGEPAKSPALRFDAVVHAYGGRRGVDGVTLDVAAGSFCVLLGQSGSGKTTLLKTANRLLEPTSGHVYVEGVDVMSMPPVLLRRRIGYAIQAVGLFPHMRVRENIAVVPELLGWDRMRIAARVDELLDLVHLPPAEYRDRFPRELSGGQQQRVGLARALAGDPAILLMDEPFGAVDAIERTHLQDELAALHRRLGKTVLFVTHDVDEALRLADTIAVMRDGRVEQSGSPLAILARPATPFVADLVGSHDALRLLSVVTVADALDGASSGSTSAQPQAAVASEATLRDALSALAQSGDANVAVERDGARVGVIGVDDMLAALRRIAGGRGR